MKMPHVSILLAVYNAERFIGSTIDSVIKQSYKDWELIIQDGESNDRTVEIARSYKNENIKITSEKDKGQGDAVWKAAHKATGEFLTVLCASDGYLHNEWLASAVEAFEDKEVSVVWGIPFDMTEEGVLEGSHYVFSRFLDSHYEIDVAVKPVGRGRKIADRLLAKDGGSVLQIVRRVNIFRLRSALGIFKKEEVPKKQLWFHYWLRTGTVFPDGNMIVAKEVFFNCMPSCEGEKSPDWMRFFFNINAKGYLSACVPMPANYGRKHDGHLADELVEFNLRTRKEYYKDIKLLSMRISRGAEEFHFLDRKGNIIENK
jgi:glycosyltransferase involved in cell wall biosynthesis